MEMNQAAIEANKRLTMERNIWRAGQPTRDMHDTLKEIESLLREILETLRNNQND